jgi:hypothetical protein
MEETIGWVEVIGNVVTVVAVIQLMSGIQVSQS